MSENGTVPYLINSNPLFIFRSCQNERIFQSVLKIWTAKDFWYLYMNTVYRCSKCPSSQAQEASTDRWNSAVLLLKENICPFTSPGIIRRDGTYHKGSKNAQATGLDNLVSQSLTLQFNRYA